MNTLRIDYRLAFVVAILVLSLMFLFGQTVNANGDDHAGHEVDGEIPAGLMLMAPKPEETHHFEVKPETLDGQRIPYMTVTVTAVPQGAGDVVEKELHAMFGGGFHYGANLALPGEEYTLKFHLEPPATEMVRGSARKDQWLEPLDFEFAFNAKEEFDDKIKIGDASTENMNILFESEHAESMWMNVGMGMGMDSGMDMDGEEQKISPLLYLVVGLIVGLIGGFFWWGRAKKPTDPQQNQI